MKKNCHKFGIILIIMILIPTTAFSFININLDKNGNENYLNKPTSSSFRLSGIITFPHDGYTSYYWYAENRIDWNFTATSDFVFLLIFDENSYYSFINDSYNYGFGTTLYITYFEYIVSMNTSINSGSYYLSQPNYWYTVFVVYNMIQSSVTINFSIEFDPYNSDLIYTTPFAFLNIITITFAILSGVIITVIILIVVRKRRFVYQPVKATPYLYGPEIKSMQRINQIKVIQKQDLNQNKLIEQGKVSIPMYCPYCGVSREIDAIFCHQCGTILNN